MEILGVGLPEIVFVLLIALIFMGPRDLEKSGRTIGAWLRKFWTSDSWKALRETGQAISDLPSQLARDANFDENGDVIEGRPDPSEVRRRLGQTENWGTWEGGARSYLPRGGQENRIQPPDAPAEAARNE